MVSKSLLVSTDHKAIHRCQPLGVCLAGAFTLALHFAAGEGAGPQQCKLQIFAPLAGLTTHAPSELPTQNQHLLSHSSPSKLKLLQSHR